MNVFAVSLFLYILEITETVAARGKVGYWIT